MKHFRQSGETADVIVNLLSRVSKNYDIENKTVSFSADNAATNFGNVNRTGERNVFKQLKEQVNAHIIGAACDKLTMLLKLRVIS